MLGHGFSSCPDKAKAYTFTKLFKDVLTVFDSYVAEGRQCVLLAHSYGCSFSVALARTRPERVAVLVLVASGGPSPLAPPPRPARPALAACLQRLLECRLKVRIHRYESG